MSRRSSILLAVALGACGTKAKPGPGASDDGALANGPEAKTADAGRLLAPRETSPSNLSEIRCERQPFAAKAPIAEASGATWMPDATLLVVGDSGTNGAYLSLSSTDGSVLSSGSLPLDRGASDDLEGLSRIGSTIYGITSSGYVREWKESGGEFALTRKSYSVAAKGDRKSVCASAMDSNCGPNYEGLCLLPHASPTAACVGFAAAKARGELVCLTQEKDGRLRANPKHTIRVASPKTLSGCHFGQDGQLWFGNNVFAANSVGVVTNYQSADSATITRLGPLGLGFSEAIAVGPDAQVYRFSDTTGSPSLLDAYLCR